MRSLIYSSMATFQMRSYNIMWTVRRAWRSLEDSSTRALAIFYLRVFKVTILTWLGFLRRKHSLCFARQSEVDTRLVILNEWPDIVDHLGFTGTRRLYWVLWVTALVSKERLSNNRKLRLHLEYKVVLGAHNLQPNLYSRTANKMSRRA